MRICVDLDRCSRELMDQAILNTGIVTNFSIV